MTKTNNLRKFSANELLDEFEEHIRSEDFLNSGETDAYLEEIRNEILKRISTSGFINTGSRPYIGPTHNGYNGAPIRCGACHREIYNGHVCVRIDSPIGYRYITIQ